jgi:hypothetical protein
MTTSRLNDGGIAQNAGSAEEPESLRILTKAFPHLTGSQEIAE